MTVKELKEILNNEFDDNADVILAIFNYDNVKVDPNTASIHDCDSIGDNNGNCQINIHL